MTHGDDDNQRDDKRGATAETTAFLAQPLDDARAAWPSVDVSAERLAAYVAERGQRDGTSDGALRVDDLYLACACADGDPDALRAFEAELMPGIDRALRKMNLAHSLADDVKQQLRTRLFVGGDSGEAPGITKYSGRGDLRGWLRVSAVRLALKALRPYRRAPDYDDDALLLQTPADQTDPELAHIKQVYRGQFKEAVARACSQLTPRERNLLRLNTIDSLSVDQIGELYQVHRATAARWVNRARERLVALTHDMLDQQLRMSVTKKQRVAELVRSQLDLSLIRVLGSGDEPES